MSCIHAILTEITVFKLIKQTFLEPPRISWTGPVKTGWITFTIFLRLLFQLGSNFVERNLDTREYLQLTGTSLCAIQITPVLQLNLRELREAIVTACRNLNSKWSKILSIVSFHGKDVAFVLGDMHLLMNIDDCFWTTSANVLTIKYNASQHKLLHACCMY
jgi:hypothetical protein